MKALIYKELRENLTLATISLVLLTILLVIAVRDCTAASALNRPMYDPRFAIMQPLLASFLLKELSIYCAGFGALLGWLQIHRERPRDLWAFLIHRPLEKSQILQAKLVAGLVLFGLVLGVPLVSFMAWVGVPGHVAAPFERRMLWPVTSCLLVGGVYYLAGLLVSLRAARWYGSRGLPLAVPLVLSFLTMALAPAISAGLILVGFVLLALAVWGAFLENGDYPGQPAAARAALLFILSLGSLMVAMVAVALLVNALHRSGDYAASSFQLLKDGRSVQWVHDPGQPVRYLDLKGQPARDLTTGRLLKSEEISPRVAPAYFVHTDSKPVPTSPRSSWEALQYFSPWHVTEREAWYYWVKHGQLVGFDLATHRTLGTFGPNGFGPQPAGPLGRFRPPDPGYNYIEGRTLNDPAGVYRIVTDERKVQPLFRPAPEDLVLGATDLSLKGETWDHTLVATKRQILLLTPEGKIEFQATNAVVDPRYTQVRLYRLEGPLPYALWWNPSDQGDLDPNSKLASHLVFLDLQGAEAQRMDLPALPSPKFTPGLEEQLMGFVIPPCLALPMKKLLGLTAPRQLLLFSVISAAICLLIGVWMARRYAFSLKDQAGWAFCFLLLGLPGLLAFLALHEWPARERCASCGKLRVVVRQHCEHCGAPFAPPAKTGTEIFA